MMSTMLLQYPVATVHGALPVTATWMAGPVLAWAIRYGRRAGTIVGLIVAGCDFALLRHAAFSTAVNGAVLLVLSGWSVGQRVALNPNGNIDGTCQFCLTGRTNFCHQATMETALGLQSDGGLEPFVVVSPKTLRRVPEGAGRLEAAWVEPTATALRAIRLAGSVAGAKVLVTGGGPIGQLACRLAAHLGAARIVLNGFELGTDAHVVRYPDRYMDERGVTMWDRVMKLIDEQERMAAA